MCCSHKPEASVPCLGRSNKNRTWEVSVFFYFSYIEMLASRRYDSCYKERLFLGYFFQICLCLLFVVTLSIQNT